MIDEKERQKLRRKRQRKRKRKKARKKFLIFLTIVIIVLAAFVITIKICNPDFDFSTLIDGDGVQQVVEIVNEDILGKTTTTTATQTQTTTEPTTTQHIIQNAEYDYVEFSDFDFDTSLQGNQIGNLLNKTSGAVTYSFSYIFYSIPGKGIYRFEPNEETNSKVKVDSYNFKYLNILDGYIYFVDTDSNALCRCSASGGDITQIAENISFAYLYNNKIYCIGTDNTVGYVTVEDFDGKTLYTAPTNKTVTFAGISLSRIFFTEYNADDDYYEYLTISVDGGETLRFRDGTLGDEILNLELEYGFMYYYQKQDDGTYNLCRQKFGSENIVTLAENCSIEDYPVIYTNRLYYTSIDGDTVTANEINMNSMSEKVMVSVGGVEDGNTLGVGYGYQYVFLCGKKTDGGDNILNGSCIYTSASSENTLVFSDGKLKYKD
ncbi:MAG: DUF5050 domain-containing protein [Clostridiales bacterium]|nr:DUF5050 domain-containing protein [Clostridiales bacterium]